MHNPKNSTQNTNIVFNYSDIKLTPAMLKILNRALNFSILPLKLDITQILVDYNIGLQEQLSGRNIGLAEIQMKHILNQYLKREKIIYLKSTQLQ